MKKSILINLMPASADDKPQTKAFRTNDRQVRRRKALQNRKLYLEDIMGTEKTKERSTILIVDDSEMNREMLSEILKDDYNTLEAADGSEAVAVLKEHEHDIDLILLDIVMPVMDGFEVLSIMNRYNWIEYIPVIMISSEGDFSYIKKAYDLGATDYIQRPYQSYPIHRRIGNTLMLYNKQKRLLNIVEEQVYSKEKDNRMMINILGHIVEFRNGESGMHVHHIQTITKLLLRSLVKKTDKYELTDNDILQIITASALHDIGKISIDDKILNKPGKLTNEEFAIMKTHAAIGADILKSLPVYQDKGLVHVAYQICRWHHERYDGRGYPDGLKGEEIPISAQVVSLADVYDALTSERCYKKAFSHEKAMEMILNGECGAFNPLLLECLKELGSKGIAAALDADARGDLDDQLLMRVTEELIEDKISDTSSHSSQLFEEEHSKRMFFTEDIREIQFEYDARVGTVVLSPYGAKFLGAENSVVYEDQIKNDFLKDRRDALRDALHRTTPEKPEIAPMNEELEYNGSTRSYVIKAMSLWSNESEPKYIGALGRIIDITDGVN